MAAARTLSAAERELLWSRMADVKCCGPVDYRRLLELRFLHGYSHPLVSMPLNQA